MSRQLLPRGERLEQAIRSVLRGVYYRHEFARRNPPLVRASDALFKNFPKSNEVRTKDSTYLIPGKQPEAITDFLIDEFEQCKEPETMRQALLDFLKKWRVLPVPPPNMKFMPFPLNYKDKTDDKEEKKRFKFKIPKRPITDAVELFVCWQRIQRFERFAMSNLGMTEPIFMPFVGLLKSIKSIFENYLKAKSTVEHKMVLINCRQPSQDLHDHLIIWLWMQDLVSRRRINIKSDLEEDEELDDETILQSRMPWGELGQYLIVYDYWQEKNKSGNLQNYVEDFATQYFPKEFNKHDIKWAQNNFATWRKQGAHWVINYRDII